MIFSSIHTRDDFKNYPAAVQRAIEYLKKMILLKWKPAYMR